MKRIGKTTLGVFFVTLAALAGGLSSGLYAQQEGDPSDVWLRGYMLMREGEIKEEEKKDLEALSKYREAQRLFDYVARTHPTWKSNMIEFRRKALLDKIEEVHGRLRGTNPEAERQYREENPGAVASAPLPGGSGTGGGITVPSNPEMTPGTAMPMAQNPAGSFQGVPVSPGGSLAVAPPPSSSPAPVESIGQEFRKLQDRLDLLTGANQRLEQERGQREQVVAGLQQQLEQSRQVEQGLRTQLTQALDDLKAAKDAGGERQRQLEEQLKLATAELREANAESAGILQALEAAKLEVAELTKQKNALLASREGEMERAAQLASELEQTAGDRDKAREERDAARAELKRLQEEAAQTQAVPMNRELAAKLAESEKQNQELMAQVEAAMKDGAASPGGGAELLAELKKSQETIVSLNAKVAELEKEKAGLQQANAQLVARQDELVKERDLLRKERDEMAILLNASDQVQGDVKDIVAANGAWREQLQEARRRTYELEEKEGSYRQEIDQLRGQLASMQEERDGLRAENDRYQSTVADLNGKLEKLLAELGDKTRALEELMRGSAALAKSGSAVVGPDGKTYSKEELEVLAGAREENELLRGIIRDQLVQQAKAHQARQLVLQELEKMDFQSELLLASLDDMAGQQIDISEEVKKMFKGREEMQLIEVVEASQESEKKFASLKTGRETVAEFPEAVAPVVRDDGDPKDLSPGARRMHITQLAKAANYDFTRGAFDVARKGYDQILAIEPNHVFALANLGLIYAQSGEPEKAKEFLRRALEQDATHAPAHYYLGWLHFRQQEYDPAMRAFEQCLTHDRNNANAHHYMGLIATEKGWVPRAEKEFLQAVELDPKHANAHFNLSVVYATREKPDKELARKHYKRARELGASPDSAMEQQLALR